jgi:putative holliday junction resolvase
LDFFYFVFVGLFGLLGLLSVTRITTDDTLLSIASVLALDIGKRRTGIAFGDTKAGMLAALDTVSHKTIEELIDKLKPIIKTKHTTKLYVGMPLLLDGTEGEQARFVRDTVDVLSKSLNLPVECIDERYTSGVTHQNQDPDAKAACALLGVVLDRERGIDNYF